jgi:hypothetical protein
MTPETIAKLEEGFVMGFTDREASLYADIAPATLYDYCKLNPDFAERKELLKEQLKIRAKINITEAITAKDKLLSQWYLERRAKDEFSPKSEVENTGSLTVNIVKYDNPATVENV